jgi:hypothetical protein
MAGGSSLPHGSDGSPARPPTLIRSHRDCHWGTKYPGDLHRTTGSGENWVLVMPSLDLLLAFNGRTPASKREEIDCTSLERLFAAVTQRYVACDGTVVNGG